MPRTSDVLNVSKRLFSGELDRDKLADLLLAFRPAGEIRWLEVGVGDGKNLRYLLSRVCREVSHSVTAIDPQLSTEELTSQTSFELIRSDFQAFEPSGKFDIINARHSIYYFGDEPHQIHRFSGMLQPHGRLAITAWAESCVLYALHHAIARKTGARPSKLTASSVNRSLHEAGLVRIAEHLAIGNVDVRHATPEQLASMVELAARNIDLSEISREQRAHIALEFFSANRDLRRHNSIALYAHTNQSS